jgi:ribosomal protein S8
MTDEIDPTKAIDFIARESKNYAQAYSDANHLERFLKTIKSQLMNEESGTLGAKEAYAYSHPKYIEMLEALKTAEMNKEHLKYMLDAAKLKVEVWKVLEYNRRVEIKNQM